MHHTYPKREEDWVSSLPCGFIARIWRHQHSKPHLLLIPSHVSLSLSLHTHIHTYLYSCILYDSMYACMCACVCVSSLILLICYLFVLYLYFTSPLIRYIPFDHSLWITCVTLILLIFTVHLHHFLCNLKDNKLD